MLQIIQILSHSCLLIFISLYTRTISFIQLLNVVFLFRRLVLCLYLNILRGKHICLTAYRLRRMYAAFYKNWLFTLYRIIKEVLVWYIWISNNLRFHINLFREFLFFSFSTITFCTFTFFIILFCVFVDVLPIAFHSFLLCLLIPFIW